MQKHKVVPRLNPIALTVASVLGTYPHQMLFAATCTANSDATLRACITNAVNGDVISVATDITLSSYLPDITKNVTVQGNNRRISGNNAHRVFWVESGAVAMSNLTIDNGLAQGGSGGGGGAGLGAGLFVNSGTVTLSNMIFNKNAAKGGIGNSGYGKGGGGMGGNGGANVLISGSNYYGGGGGGRQRGDNGGNANAASSYYDSSCQCNIDIPASPGSGVGGGGNGGTGYGANGGFGGGGGGGGSSSNGGSGGFGGGGGNGGFGDTTHTSNGGNGGFGGGGGAGFGTYTSTTPTYMCSAGYTLSGNNCYSDSDPSYWYPATAYYATSSGQGGNGGFGAGKGNNGNSGGGFGAGAAIFAKAGALTLKNVAFAQNSSSGGTGANAGQGKASGIFICTPTEDSSCAASVTAGSCGIVFSGNTATNAGTTNTDNADTFNLNRSSLAACLPTASVNTPTVITPTSAKLSGTVHPGGANTAVNFDFGATTSYGQTIIATPAGIPATASFINVSADATDLVCNAAYHYRVKAVNSAGTGYSTDKSFSTNPCPAPNSIHLTNGVAVTNQTIAVDEWKYFYITVPAGADTLKFVTTGTGDVDIYAQINVLPTDTFACSSENGGSIETCQPATTTAGTWWLGVYAYEDSTFSVTGSFRQTQTIGAINFNPATLTAGQTTTASATASSGLPVTFTSTTSDICSATGTNGSVVQGLHIGTCTVTANQNGDGNYIAATAVSKNITVGKGTQTVSLACNPANITVGTSASCTATATSGLTTTVTAAPSSVCTLSGSTGSPTTLAGVTVGTCTVTATQAGNADFAAATAVTTSVPVAKGNQTITLTCSPLSIAVAGTATCTATASSNLTPSLSVVDPSICTIANSTVTGIVAGICGVKAKQVGNTNYNAATPVTQNITVGNVEMYTVTPTAGTGGTVTPNTAQRIAQGSKANFTVTANTGYSTNSIVTGTCPQGSWSGNVWTTGAIIANCSVSFSFNPKTYNVTPSAGSGGTVNPNTVQTVTHGSTKSFTVTPNTDYTINNAVSGTCPSGAWNGNIWTTGAILADCNVSFSFNYNPIAVNGVCGSTNGGTFAIAPTTNLCNSGTASTVTAGSTSSPNNYWTWNCNGSNGGSSVNCTANLTQYTVTSSANPIGGGTINPSTAQLVNSNTVTSFTVTANSGYTKNTAVTGTCPQGTWTGNVWKTGAITTNCSVMFGFTALPVNSWLNPAMQTVIRDKVFTLDVIANSNSVKLGSYMFVVTLDTTKLSLDVTYQNANGTCSKGVCPGLNPAANRATIVNAASNTITLTGDDSSGVGPGNDLQLLVMHFKAKLTTGATPVTLTTSALDATSGETIGLSARGATVNVSYGYCGDSDGNLAVNIVDALAIARKLVGLNPPPTVDVTLADVNKNARLDINDALMIARYSIGLVLPPEVCEIGMAL